MALIKRDSGCKVGWLTFDNEAEARECAARAKVEARQMEARGYDWGFQTPGEVRENRPGEWTVTTP